MASADDAARVVARRQAGLPRTRFVILSVPRTGSNYLCSLLNSHPDILCHHEIFNPDGIRYALGRRDGSLDLGTVGERDRDPVGFLERLWRAHLQAPVLGFKLAWRHPEVVFRNVYDDSNVRKIVLLRRNRVKMYVSEQVAKAEGRWTHYYMKPSDLRPIQVDIDVDDLLRYLRVMDRFFAEVYDNLHRRGQTCLHLHYEDLFTDHVQERALEFLGIENLQAELRAATVKRNSSNLRDVVKNFEVVAERLHGTDLAAELQDATG